MDTDIMLNTGIVNIDTVYGGIRGTTLSSHRNLRYWKTVVECGIKAVIELRNTDHSERLCELCREFNIRYFPFPLDSHKVPDEEIATRLDEFFCIIDGGEFYIACAMGLHRTDMALSIYWVLHGADRNLPPPYLKGHFPSPSESDRKNVNPENINRRLNSLYKYLIENGYEGFPDKETFIRRKQLLLAPYYKMEEIIADKCKTMS